MRTVQLTYDADKHGLAVKEPGHQSVAMGCTYHAWPLTIRHKVTVNRSGTDSALPYGVRGR